MSAFVEAAAMGHLEVLQGIENNEPNKLQAIIEADNYAAFRSAASRGHLKILHYLEQKAPHRLQAMIQANNYAAFRWAAANGHLEILHYLEQKAPDKLQAMIRANERIDLETPNFRYQMSAAAIQKRSYAAFRHAAKWGHLKILQYLEQKAPDKLQAMIQATDFNNRYDYAAFCLAARNGYLEILHYLEQKAPHQLQAMIQANDYAAFCDAATCGQLKTLHYLEQKAPDKLQAMIQALAKQDNQLRVFDGALFSLTSHSNLETLQYLQKKSPDKFQAIIQSRDYSAFRDCARANNTRTSLYNFLRWIGIYDRWWFPRPGNYAEHQSREKAAAYFLSFTYVFSYAESHAHEYSSYVHPIVDAHLTTLKSQKNEFEQREPNALFNITVEEARKSFYCLRNLIRRNDSRYRDDILFLINIPGVKALLHTEVTAHQSNELLRLAMSLGNREALTLLLDVPAVRQLAQENNHYQDEARNGLDAGALAQYNESSMSALTIGEQKRIAVAQTYYEPIIQQKGVAKLMNELRAKLEARYAQNPAYIILNSNNGEPIRQMLPLKRKDFDLLPLSKVQKEEALKAYYRHTDHCALRYLSKPNSWMHTHAAYVNENPRDPTQKWSTFDEYEPLIALLYVAATDEKTPATDGYTIETRFERFIAELAQINRAHNWDKSRNKGKEKEEYDDMGGDRPSCFSGVKRRLFQSVLGHPLFNLFTADVLKTELRDFTRAHFKQAITRQNRQQLNKAWDNVCMGDELSDEQKQLFKSLDINAKQQEQFIALLNKKYGEQFSSDSSYQLLIAQAFKLKQPTENHACSSAFATTKWWDFLGPQAAFLELLRTLEKKKEERLVDYPAANEQAKIIIKGLTQKANTFYQIQSPTAKQHEQFKSDCLEVIHQNSSALLEHRAFLGALFAAFRQFFNALMNTVLNKPSRYGFFESKPESAKILQEMELEIERLSCP